MDVIISGAVSLFVWIFLLIVFEYFFHEYWRKHLFQEVHEKEIFYHYKQVPNDVHATCLFEY